MNVVRKRKLRLILLILLVLSTVLALILYALKQNISLFYSPSQVVHGEANHKTSIRLGGMVVKKSVYRDKDQLTVHFSLTDFKDSVSVSYRGILPDLFREGQGIVAMGRMLDNRHFQAVEVLAKHDEKYMPPPMKDWKVNTQKGEE